MHMFSYNFHIITMICIAKVTGTCEGAEFWTVLHIRSIVPL
jgi:hypothetical protein